MLTSAGITNKTLENALKKLAGNKIWIAFIPTAANVEEGDKEWLINDFVNCKKLGDVDIVDISAPDKNIWLPRLKKANVIFVGGGNTAYLMNWVRKSGLDKELSELLKTRIYVGISAGSIILSDSIQTASEYLFRLYDDEIENPPEGLNFVDFYVRPHLNSEYFVKVRDEKLKKVFKKLDKDVYALDDNSALIFDNGRIEIVSEGEWKKYVAS
jgi:dipeptidase E